MKALLLTIGFLCLALPALASGSYEVTDAFGKHRFDAPPARVVVTDWTLLENLLELGITPVGAPELEAYRRHVQWPALPQDITDIGLRQAPSIKALATLTPELIILGTGQKDLARPFSRISRVAWYKFFSERYRTNGSKARTRFLQIAELFQRTTVAENKLAAMDTRIAELRSLLMNHFGSQLPDVTAARTLSPEKLAVYGPNSLPGHALEQLGLVNARSFKGNAWGEKELAADIAAGNGRLLILDGVWPYGGALSVGRIAEAITAGLLEMSSPSAP